MGMDAKRATVAAVARTFSETDIHAPACPARIHRPPTPPSPFRFLDLPPELQSAIASHVLVSSTSTPSGTSRALLPAASEHPTIRIRLPRFNRHPSPPPTVRARPKLDRPVPASPPASRSPSAEARDHDLAKGVGHTRLALLLACNRLYQDHWRTYYSRNKFEFADFDTFEGFVSGIPSRCAAEIRLVRFRMPHKYGHDKIWKGLAGLEQLNEVELVLHPVSKAAASEYHALLDGAPLCKSLTKVEIRRRIEDEEDKNTEEDYDGRGAVGGDDQQDQDQAGGPGNGGHDEEHTEASEENRDEAEVLAKDRSVERKINAILQQRSGKKKTNEAAAAKAA